jgi:murein DD-endopeptidase MepM/ murein hydrolase activator NlpD
MKRVLYLVVCLLLALSSSMAWSQRSSYDPPAEQQSKSREGFADFALKQINPQNIDYGCQMDEARKLAVEQTIRSIDSWAVFCALTFLVLSFFMLLHQRREGMRREAIAAEFLAQYHNTWVDARIAAHAIRRYNDLVHTTRSAGDAVPVRSPSLDVESVQTTGVKSELGRNVKPQSAPAAAAKSTAKTGENVAGWNDGTRHNRKPELDLIAQIVTLQQQLNASYEREKNLQKQLNKAQRRAPALLPTDTNLPGRISTRL